MTKLTVVKQVFGGGGRTSNAGLTVTVFGGHGFIGRYFLNYLGSSGARVNLPYRGDEFEVRHIKPMFDLGQLALHPFHPRDRQSIRESISRSDVIVNLIGKDFETKHAVPTRKVDGSISRVNYDFYEVHSDIARNIAEVAKECGIETFIHFSALSASSTSASKWSRSKASGEEAVRKAFPEAIIIRPSTVFGPEDRFLNRIAETITKLPFFPLVNGGSNLVQPVFVLDVARGILEIIQNRGELQGRTFEFAGPVEYSHREIVQFVQDVIMRKKVCLEFSPSSAKLFGRLVEQLINPIFTADTVNQLLEDNVLQHKASISTLSDLGINPSRVDRHAFDYLHRFRQGGHFALVRGYH